MWGRSTGVAFFPFPSDSRFEIEWRRALDDGTGQPDLTTITTVGRHAAGESFVDRLPDDGRLRHYQARQVRPGYDPGEWVGWLSARPRKLPPLLPPPNPLAAVVREQPSEDGSSGVLTLPIDDPQLRVASVEFWTQTGNEAPTDWFEDASVPYSAVVALVEKHPGQIGYRVTGYDAAGTLRVLREDVVRFGVGARPLPPLLKEQFSAAGDLSVRSTGDSDTATHKVVASSSGEPTAAEVRAAASIAGRSITTATLLAAVAPGEEIHIAAFAYSAGGLESDKAYLTAVREGEGAGKPTVDLLELDTSTSITAKVQLAGTVGEGGKTPLEYAYKVSNRLDSDAGFSAWAALGAGVILTIDRHAVIPKIVHAKVRDAAARESEVARLPLAPSLDVFDAVGRGHGRGERESDRTGRPGLPGRRRNATQQLSDDGVDVLVDPLTRRVGTGLAFPGGLGMDTGEEYAGRAGAGLAASTGLVALDVPLLRAAAEIDAVQKTGSGLLITDGTVLTSQGKIPLETDDDFSLLSGRTADALSYLDATPVESLKPAEAGAETTAGKSLTVLVDRTAANIGETATRVWPTPNQRDGGGRGYAGLGSTGLVQLDVPVLRAAAELDALDALNSGRLDPSVPVNYTDGLGNPVYAADSEDSVELFTDGAEVKSNAAAGKAADDDLTAIPDIDRTGNRVTTAKRVEDEVGTQTLESTRGARRKSHDGAGVAARGLVEAGRDREGQPGLSGARATSQTPVTADGVTELYDPDTGRLSGMAFPGGLSASDGEDYAGRAGSGLSVAGVVQLDVPVLRAAAELDALDKVQGRLDTTVATDTGGLPIDSLDSVDIFPDTGVLATKDNADEVPDGATKRVTTLAEANGGGKADATLLAANQINPDALIQEPTVALNIAKGVKHALAFHDQGVVFNPPFETTPIVHVGAGGLYFDPGLNYTAKKLLPKIQALNLDANGFTVSAKLSEDVGGTTLRTATFSGTDANKGFTPEAWDDKYTFQYDVSVNGATPGANIGDPLVPSSITLGFWTNDGSGWVLRATKKYSNSASGGVTYTDEKLAVVVDLMGLNDDFRISVESTENLGGSVTRDNVTWDEATEPASRFMTEANGASAVSFLAVAGT